MSHGRPQVMLVMRGRTGEAGAASPVSIHGLPALDELRKSLERDGYAFREYEGDEPPVHRPLAVLWDFGSVAKLPTAVERAARNRIVAWCLESPLVAHRAYHRLPQISRTSSHIFGFRGVAAHVSDTAAFHELTWPNRRRIVEGAAWEERRFLTMINSNKRATQGLAPLSPRRPYTAARILAAAAVSRTYRLRGSWTVPDLYATRLDAISYFSSTSDFDLYGMGWDKRSRARHRVPDIARCYRGPVADKLHTLSRYKFALAFENTVFPGYATEKIFDVLFAGAIPVYLGAPDIERDIPRRAFVDMRQFDGFGALHDHLRRMTPQEAEERRNTAIDFLQSPDFARFSEQSFVSQMRAAVRDVLPAPVTST